MLGQKIGGMKIISDMEKAQRLFTLTRGMEVRDGKLRRVRAEVANFSEDRILNTDMEALLSWLVDLHAVDLPVLDFDNITVDRKSGTLLGRDAFSGQIRSFEGVAFDFEVPFSGDGKFFQINPGQADLNPPVGEVRDRVLAFRIQGTNPTTDGIAAELEITKASLRKYMQWHQEFWADLPSLLENTARSVLQARRLKLETEKGVEAGLASLGVRLKEKPGDPQTYMPPAIKQTIAPKTAPHVSARETGPLIR
jgi:hypothetical protein